jgi:hypothetical protein
MIAHHISKKKTASWKTLISRISKAIREVRVRDLVVGLGAVGTSFALVSYGIKNPDSEPVSEPVSVSDEKSRSARIRASKFASKARAEFSVALQKVSEDDRQLIDIILAYCAHATDDRERTIPYLAHVCESSPKRIRAMIRFLHDTCNSLTPVMLKDGIYQEIKDGLYHEITPNDTPDGDSEDDSEILWFITPEGRNHAEMIFTRYLIPNGSSPTILDISTVTADHLWLLKYFELVFLHSPFAASKSVIEDYCPVPPEFATLHRSKKNPRFLESAALGDLIDQDFLKNESELGFNYFAITSRGMKFLATYRESLSPSDEKPLTKEVMPRIPLPLRFQSDSVLIPKIKVLHIPSPLHFPQSIRSQSYSVLEGGMPFLFFPPTSLLPKEESPMPENHHEKKPLAEESYSPHEELRRYE